LEEKEMNEIILTHLRSPVIVDKNSIIKIIIGNEIFTGNPCSNEYDMDVLSRDFESKIGINILQRSKNQESTVLDLTRSYIATLPDKKRMHFFEKIIEGYCTECGCEEKDKPLGCQCWNDE
jgi:hypothetical protein